MTSVFLTPDQSPSPNCLGWTVAPTDPVIAREKRDEGASREQRRRKSGVAQGEKCKRPSLGRVDEKENSAKLVLCQLRLLYRVSLAPNQLYSVRRGTWETSRELWSRLAGVSLTVWGEISLDFLEVT